MKRAAQERSRTLHVWRRHLSSHDGDAAKRCVCNLQPGRFRKGRRIGGCGRPRCHLCHGDKLAKRPTTQQRRADRALTEWLQET